MGQGAYGSVFQACLKSAPDQYVVLKVFSNRVTKKAVIAEATIQLYLEDTRVVPKMHGVIFPGGGGGAYAMVQEYCADGQTLADALEENRLSEHQWVCVCRQLTSALWTIHQREVIHNDLKTDNVLLEGPRSDGYMSIFIIDLGLATYKSGRTYTIREEGKCTFLAPEIRLGQPTAIASDMYSLGYIMKKICETGAPCLTDLAARCMSEDPASRLNTARVFSQMGDFGWEIF